MRTALLPLKLRRKRRRCTRLDSNERLRSFNPPLLPPQLRVQDLELPVGFEPTISRLQGGCIGQLCYGSGTRIRGLDLGTVARFHLSRVSSYTTGLRSGTPYRYRPGFSSLKGRRPAVRRTVRNSLAPWVRFERTSALRRPINSRVGLPVPLPRNDRWSLVKESNPLPRVRSPAFSSLN